ncbi:MAG: asparagine synthase (glutamine-hydrolyzing) [Coxiella sp. RIFCSPHIGHO2_12_FULL_44_14]|nr:MAG: asparagine synthase (glutamine-hydrolyzing) [Coxiella sp. RIFCSPHIGHO2_12_FULL_44_14]
MCGIAGFWNLQHHLLSDSLENIAQAMAHRVRHRGPNSSGTWCDSSQGIAFGHQRLSIVDLSSAGHQPMVSQTGHSVIAYNGEVYNAPELREALRQEGVLFRGRADTEVVLEACERWGIAATVKRLIGMFAFAWWDGRCQRLFLVRDRLGIKPLYWGFHRGSLIFGSELKSFFAYPNWHPEIDRNALISYFRFNYIAGTQSIYLGIHKLKPGTYVQIDGRGHTETHVYWDLLTVFRGASAVSRISAEETIVQLNHLLRDAVRRRLLADVPVGAFLSGGIDSSLVVALMQSESSQPVKTFTVGFCESTFDEAPYAKAVAERLGTDHHELYVRAEDAMRVIPLLSDWYDEPFADSSQIPTYLVSQLASTEVKVSLSGDGGDEVFIGYDRYLLPRLLIQLASLPLAMRQGLARSIKRVSPGRWNQAIAHVPYVTWQNMGSKLHKFADMLSSKDPSFYKRLVSLWGDPAALVIDGQENNTWVQEEAFHRIEYMSLIDLLTYLPEDILTKVDRASMAVSLEARVPLLDHRVIEWAASLPYSIKIRHGQKKWLLRQLLQSYIPEEWMHRPKQGFAVPIGEWLRGPLREWAEDLLSEYRLQSASILYARPIRERWQQHLSGRYEWGYSLWGVLMFQAWHQKWL